MFEGRLRHSQWISGHVNSQGMKKLRKIRTKYHMKLNGQAERSPINLFTSACTDGLIFPNSIFILLLEDPPRLQLSRSLCWRCICLCKSGFVGDNKPSWTGIHRWRTSFPQTGHLVIFLCRHLFFLQIPGSLPETWCSEDESDQATS